MKRFKKYRLALILLGLSALLCLGAYAYNQVGYHLTINDVSQIAYRNAGVTSKNVQLQKFSKKRLGLVATYEVKLETKTRKYSYVINATSGSIIERHYKKK